MTAFVTVGTTRFDDLINAVLSPESLDSLQSIGITSVLLQIGAGNFTNEVWSRCFKDLPENADEGSVKIDALTVSFYRYKPSIIEDIKNAKVVIGHAGAGTVLDTMKLRKPMIVVINGKLMNNHQSELAETLAAANHLVCCEPAGIVAAVLDKQLFSLQPFDPPSLAPVAKFIDTCVGLARS